MFINDKYQVIEILGKGGNGIVYKVREKNGERLLAIKEIIADPDENNIKNVNEAKVLKQCFHPALPVIVEDFWQDERYYLVMELIEGITLNEYVGKVGRISQEKALKFALEIGEALNYLHTRSQAIYHGDLKPQNIMLTEEGQIRLIDFGSAVTEGSGPKGCHASPAYAAPEQLKGKLPDNRSDIYALGALMHYMLTGEDPEEPPYIRRDLRECDASISKGLCRVVNKSLKELPQQRYQTVKGMIDDLHGYSKKDRQYKLIWQIEQSLAILLLLAFSGFVYQAIEYRQWGAGYGNNLPVYIAGMILLAFLLLRSTILINPGSRNRFRIEKNIRKTDKKGIGLLILLAAIGIFGMKTGVEAKDKRDILPVIVYDESGSKILWQDDRINALNGAFRTELPKECFEPGKEYNIIMTLEDKETKKMMVRYFEVKTVKSSIEN